MGTFTRTHSWANKTPATVTLFTMKPYGDHGHMVATFDCLGSKHISGGGNAGHYRFTVVMTPKQIEMLRRDIGAGLLGIKA